MTNPPFSVVVVSADASAALRIAMALQPIAGIHVVSVDEREDLVATVRAHDPLVVVGDASLVADEGRHVADVRAARAGIGFVVVTERPSLSDAVLALRARVDEFFPGEVADDRLREAVESVAATARLRLPAVVPGRVLVVGASLDAVLPGAGGTILMHVEAGDQVVVATLDEVADGPRPAALDAVTNHLGASIVPLAGRDATDDELRAALASLVDAQQPTLVSTHAASDASAAHRRLQRIVMEATPDVARVSCFQSSESSIDFAPTLFVDVDRVLEQKLAAMAAWSDDAAAAELVRASAAYWSRFGSGRACEPFELLRDAVTTGTERTVEVVRAPVASA
ncbi:hypothetical protein [Agrococcus jejuensis]|uniref:hypothetical protein n=1 Tax=Agrococcus jejuensis TaxID=399736 RepID=UPI00164337A6|nr:hypothetical protein [Agrococcus jejuensis]